MPTYPLRCTACGWTGEKIAPMAQRDALRCDCGSPERLETVYESLIVKTDIEYNNGRGAESLAMGCHPSEIGTYQKHCPSAEIRPDGTFVVRNRSHYRRVEREIAAMERSLSRS